MKKLIVCLLIIMILLVGCSQETPDTVGAYTTVIDMLYNEDMALNSDIKYIAIDTSLMINLSEEQKQILLKQLDKYGHTVLDMTFEELEKEGYIEELQFKEGIFFKISDELINGKSITMDVQKWRSGLGAIGYDDLVVKYTYGNWKITKTGSAWIS